jgi:pectate lyase
VSLFQAPRCLISFHADSYPIEALTGIGLVVKGSRNVIVRNFKISSVLAAHGAAITIANSSNVWVDHCDISSDLDHGEGYYADLLDIGHGADYSTVTYNLFHNHSQASLVGLSDQDSKEDSGKLHITFANNQWLNIKSSALSYRFGTGHVFK